jgi:hypothetical protein
LAVEYNVRSSFAGTSFTRSLRTTETASAVELYKLLASMDGIHPSAWVILDFLAGSSGLSCVAFAVEYATLGRLLPGTFPQGLTTDRDASGP